MLRGRFGNTTGRPYIEGRLVIPRLNTSGDISFLVDTGADQTLLAPADGLRIGLDYADLHGDGKQIIGIGGVTENFVEDAVVVFADGIKVIYGYTIQLGIAPPSPDIMDIPSLLGRDIIDHWRMIYNPTRRNLSFTVISADFQLNVPSL